MNIIKENFLRLIKRIRNSEKINKKLYKGKIFREDLQGMFFWNKLPRRKDELISAYQRAKNGYAKWEVYDIKSWFAINITHMLHDMILNLHSYPMGMSYDEWKSILKQMHKHFKLSLSEDETDFEHSEEAKKHLKDGLNLFVKYFDDLWD